MDGKRNASGWVPKGLIYILCLLILLSLYLTVPAFAQQENSRVVRVGPFPYDDQLKIESDGSYSGYGFDYLMELAQYTGWKYEFVDATWQEALVMLEKGEIDLLGAAMKSPQREATYDFSDYAMISGYGVLATNLSNEEIPYEDFSSFNGLKVGVLKGNLQGDRFLQYSQQSGFTPRILSYKTENELNLALARGDVQAVVLTNTLRSADLRVIARFGENDSYFAVTKGNTKVLGPLNDAMRQIRINTPYFNSELNQRYYNLQAATLISFTKEELNYIKNSGPVPCVYDSMAQPISYYDGSLKEAKGIAIDVAKLLEEKTGLKLDLIPAESMDEAASLFEKGEAALLLTKIHDLSWAQKNNAFLTKAYLQGQMTKVSNGQDSEDAIVALCDRTIKGGLPPRVNGVETVMYEGIADCLDAVREGEADVTFMNSIVVSYQMNNPKYTQLKTTPIYGDSADTCIAVNGGEDPLLLSVLNKGLSNISAAQINDIISYNMRGKHVSSLLEFLYMRPLEVILLVCLPLIAFLAVLLVLLRYRMKNARAMKVMLYTDSLTGYPNYKAMEVDALDLIGSQPEKYALIYMGMRQFKAINDTFGYEAGDKVLKTISDILNQFITYDERFARIYADTFVLFVRYENEELLNSRLNELSMRLEELSRGEFVEGNFLFAGGIYRLEKGFVSLDKCCDKANYAKGSIKEYYANTFVFYDDVMRNRILEERYLEKNMIPAFKEGEFVSYYQPKVNVLTGEVVGAEALVRWIHPERGCMLPSQFLSFYEKNGFIVKIDFLMFEEVCRNIRKWIDGGNRPVPVSVNFSRRHIYDKQFPQKLKEIVERNDVPIHLLEIEITETLELESVDTALSFVESLKALGFIISIDDYGVGYSSISFLQELPLDVLKLDKKFIENAMETRKAKDILRHLIMAMKDNGILIICEGIETKEQEDFIISLNCRFAQGYLYSRPLSRLEFEAYLRNSEIGSLHSQGK